MSDRYDKRVKVCVFPSPQFGKFKYGFSTNASSAEQTALGQIPAKRAGGDWEPGVLFFVDYPKPRVYQKHDVALGYDSSYTSHTKWESLEADGWTMTADLLLWYPSNGPRSRPVFIDYRIPDPNNAEDPSDVSIRYAWNKADVV